MIAARWKLCVLLGYGAALAAGSLAPSGTPNAPAWDKAVSPGVQNLLHVPAYGVLAATAIWAIGPGRRPRRLPATVVACIAYGALLEVGQAFVPGRTGSAADALLNAIGAGGAGLGCWVWIRLRRRSVPGVRNVRVQRNLNCSKPALESAERASGTPKEDATSG